MKAYQKLPGGYHEIMQFNLQSDKKTSSKINIGALITMAVVFAAGHFIVPLSEFFGIDSFGAFFLRLVAILVAYLLYAVLHELTHAAVMKAVGAKKVIFGFTGIYAYAGSRVDFFDKISYRVIALAPLVVWGIIFGILAFAVPRDWFWVVWFLQAGNIGGAAGDIYVTIKLWKKRASIIVKDTGIDMTVYDRQ